MRVRMLISSLVFEFDYQYSKFEFSKVFFEHQKIFYHSMFEIKFDIEYSKKLFEFR